MSKRGSREKSNNSSFRQKKGQVTIFVILGIVMFVVLIFAIFVSSTVAKIKIQGAANKAVDAYLASESINYYIYTCMDSAVTSSVEDLALQGGVFFDYQDGPYKITPADVGKTFIPYSIATRDTNLDWKTNYFNVSYSILNHSYCDIVNLTLPGYPYNTYTYLSDLFGMYNDRTSNICLYNSREGYALSGFAGFNNMTRLCMLGSENTRTISRIERSPCYGSAIQEKNRSVEYILEQQISKRMGECANFSMFKDDNITNLSSPTTQITYTSDSMLVETTYNLSVKIGNKEPVVVKHTFTYATDLRIVKLHNLVMSLLRMDSQDFYFNINQNYASYSTHPDLNPAKFYDEYMSVKVINFSTCMSAECQSYKYDELLIVQDNKSKIGNRSLMYITAIKNRRPALDYIHYTLPSSAYDIVVAENHELILQPQGYDPDDKIVGYKYEGWKETLEDTCIIEETEDPAYPSGRRIICTSVPKLMNNWSQSKLYLDTKRSANITTNSTDIGYHNVTITVNDVSGLSDYQVVRIMVFDLPNASINELKLYPDIDAGIGSIEDAFMLNSSGSTMSTLGGGDETQMIFKWKIFLKNNLQWDEVFFNNTKEKTVMVPTESYIVNNATLIQIIRPVNPLNLSNVGLHNVTLVLESYVPLIGEVIQSNIVSRTLDVKECVPHKNTLDPYSFPYNTGDPFSANHTCCDSDFTVRENNAECYETERYGELKLLKAESLVNTLSQNSELNNYPKSTALTTSVGSGKPNDVYKLTFERFCDGERGNICAGPMKTTITVSASCTAKPSFNQESCTGPPSNGRVSESVTGCEAYTAPNTFERIYGTGTGVGTGICNNVPVCSTPRPGGYGDGGPMMCTATCGSGYCTNARLTECQCDVDDCPTAECDSADDFKRDGKSCRSYCNTASTCRFQATEELPCTGTECRAEESGYEFIEGYCYYDVGCNSNGKTFRGGDFCVAGEIIDSMTCLHHGNSVLSNPCTAQGTCRLETDMRPSDPCPDGQSLECDEYTGWTCTGLPGSSV